MRSDRRLMAWIVALVLLACGEVHSPNYFKSEVDSDVGDNLEIDVDGGGAPPEGDPCSGDTPWTCDPLSGEGCEGDDIGCDHGIHGGVAGFYCFEDASEPEGAPCMIDEFSGPWCATGMTCRDGACARFCCNATDCDEESCEPYELENVLGDALGTCSSNNR